MYKHQDWLCDETFDKTPLLYKQLSTIHIIYKGILLFLFILFTIKFNKNLLNLIDKPLPLLYSFLPNKELTTYAKLFAIILENGILPPLTLNCYFEKAIHGAARKVSKGCIILGCFFICVRIGGKGLAL